MQSTIWSKSYFSAKEIAGLPGMPTSERGVQLKAGRESWTSQLVDAKGGRNGKRAEYHIDSLPAETRAYVHLQHHKQAPPAEVKASVKRDLNAFKRSGAEAEAPAKTADHSHLWVYYEAKPERAKQEAQRKHVAILAVLKLIEEGESKCDAYKHVAAQVGDSWQTVSGWLKKVRGIDRSDWLPALVDQYAGRQKKAECSIEAWDSFKADYLRRGLPTSAACYDRLKRAAKKNGWTIPSLKTLMRRLENELRREAIILAREGEDGLKKCYPDQERDHTVFSAMEAINGDGYTFWPHVDFGNDIIVRPTAWVWQDIHSSKIISYRVDVSENTEIIRLSAGDLVERYGIPSDWWLDNTRAAANKTMTGGIANRYRFKVKDEDPMGIIPMLGATAHWCTPGHGQGKPVERVFGRGGLSEYVDKHPAWEGRGTKKRPVPLAEFLQILETEINAFNAREGRTGRGMNGRSFDRVFAESYTKTVVRKATAEQRRLWLLACDNVTCNREDASVTIKFYNGPQGQNRYWAECLSKYASRKITVRFDPQSLQSAVHCYTLDGRYIGQAQCILGAGFNDQDAARDHARARNTYNKAIKVALKAEKRMTALQAASYIPPVEAPDPLAPAAVQATFKRAVGSDIQGTDHEDSFKRAVEQMQAREIERRKTRI